MLTWCETASLFNCFLGLVVCLVGTGGESGTTGRGKEEKTDHIHTSDIYTDRGKERMREETQWMLSISFCLSENNLDILFSTLPRGRTYFFVFLHFGSQNASSGLIQIHQVWREPVFFPSSCFPPLSFVPSSSLLSGWGFFIRRLFFCWLSNFSSSLSTTSGRFDLLRENKHILAHIFEDKYNTCHTIQTL